MKGRKYRSEENPILAVLLPERGLHECFEENIPGYHKADLAAGSPFAEGDPSCCRISHSCIQLDFSPRWNNLSVDHYLLGRIWVGDQRGTYDYAGYKCRDPIDSRDCGVDCDGVGGCSSMIAA